MEELMLIENPYRRHHRRSKKMKRNPVAGVTKEWFQGVSMMDAGAALGGLAAATIIPGAFVKTADTTQQKLMKIGVAALATVAAGFVFRNVSANAGKMAIAGGLAGTLSQVIGTFTSFKIGGQLPQARPVGRITRGMGESRYAPMVPEEAGVQVSVT